MSPSCVKAATPVIEASSSTILPSLSLRTVVPVNFQQVLGGHIGLTFQQIQKYEKGTNRIGASRLQQIGRVLEVPTSYFFEGAPGGWQAGKDGGAANTFLELLGTRDGQLLVLSFSKIVAVRLRRSIVDLVERLGAIGARGSPKPTRSKPKRK
jgi:hypothetical protein